MSVKLPLPVRRVLREPMSDAAIERLVASAARPQPDRRVPWATLSFGALALATAGALGIAWPRGHEGPLHDVTGAALAERLEARVPTSVALDDGSMLTLGGSSALATLENDAHDVSFLLENGSVTFDVRPHGPRRWTIECGLATVTVVGTRLTIVRAPHRLEVSVERGVVLVRGERVPWHARRLTQGERIEVVDEEDSVSLAVPALVPAPEAPQPRPRSEPAPSTPIVQRPRGVGWRALAEQTRWDDAYRALGPSGVAGASDQASVADLLVLADVARLSGHLADAVVPLERVVNEHQQDPNASLAALSLGRIEDRLSRPARAAAAFGRALELGRLPRDLRAAALSRRASSLEQAGDHAAAVQSARAYLAEFPEGSDAAAMRAMEERSP